MLGCLTTWVENLKYSLNLFNVAYQSFVSHSKMSEVTDAVTWNSSRSHLRLFLRNFLITELMVSCNENFHSKFEVTMCFIVMSRYYFDGIKNARAYACCLGSERGGGGEGVLQQK